MCASCRETILRYRDSCSYLRSLVSGARSRSKRKGLPYDLDGDWAVEEFRKNSGLCSATGIPLTIPKRRRKKGTKTVPIHSPSIDRIDSNLGYLRSNCRIVSLCFNSMKGPFYDEALYTLCLAFIATYENKIRNS